MNYSARPPGSHSSSPLMIALTPSPSPHRTLLQRNKSRRVRRTNTRPTMLNRLVRDRELPQVVSHHLRLDFDLIELLSAVDSNDGADHLGNDDHVAQVGFDQVGLLVGLGFLLGLAQFLDQAHGAALEASVEAAAGAGVEDC
jgi:hypothetical protein